MDIPQRIWEQEIYLEFQYQNPKNDVHTFEADYSMVALHFAQQTEAQEFYQQVIILSIYVFCQFFLKNCPSVSNNFRNF